MRYIRYAFLAALAIILVPMALANRQPADLRLFPPALEELFGFNMQITLPLFALVLGGMVAGLIIGFFWEWMREYKHRKAAAEKAREVRRLERQVNRLKDEKNQGKDEVLAILDEAS